MIISALAIWAAVPTEFGTRKPGLGGRVNVSVGAMRQYSADVRIMPRYPRLRPPKVVGTKLVTAVRTGCSK